LTWLTILEENRGAATEADVASGNQAVSVKAATQTRAQMEELARVKVAVRVAGRTGRRRVMNSLVEGIQRDLERIEKRIPFPLRVMTGVTPEMAREIRKVLRQIPTGQLQEAHRVLTEGAKVGMEMLDRDRAVAIRALEEILGERGKLWRRL